jgi:cysteine-rich repeat protein
MKTTLQKKGWFAAAIVMVAVACAGRDFGSQKNLIINEGPECVGARTPGFWCQNQDGQNPNLSVDEFNELAEQAAGFLTGVDALDTPEEIAAAVCDTSDQLVRHLAATVLDLQANLIDEDTPLVDEGDYGTVGEVVAEAIAILKGESDADAEEIKDILDRINNNENTVLGEECVPDEEEPSCGDGNVDEGEQCDDGNDVDDDTCANDCTTNGGEEPSCGDGNVDEGEQCDDGNDVDDDTCANDCTTNGGEEPSCGDGNVDEGEQCDDGNDVDDDTCANDCTENGGEEPFCGDGVVNSDEEECDDGNDDDEDGCSRVCTIENN